MPDIVLDKVSKSFTKQTHAVEDLSLVIPDGSFTTLLGPSGCGKTTTLRMIAGLEQPTSGEIVIGDSVVFSGKTGAFVAPAKRDLGLVFQSYALHRVKPPRDGNQLSKRFGSCLLYTSPSPRDVEESRMPSSA